MHSAGVSLSLSLFPGSFSLPLTTSVVKNSLDAVCIASSRMSPSKADCVGNGGFRGPEGIYGAPSVCAEVLSMALMYASAGTVADMLGV